MGKIRLACMFCDRTDYDGVNSIPKDWFAVDNVQTYEESIREADLEDTKISVLDWYTHLGVCPQCQRTELWPTELSA